MRIEIPIVIPNDGPYDLDLTLSTLTMGRGNPCLRHNTQAAEAAEQTPEGSVVLRAERLADHLAVTAEGPGADWIAPHVPALFGLEDDPATFQPTGKLRRLARRHAGLHLPKLPTVFPRLVQIVLQQLIPFRDACRGWRRLVLQHGEPVPGVDELYFPPTAKTLARLAVQQYVECDILPRHARVIIALAKQAAGLERLWNAGAEADAADRLCEFLLRQPGVGPWTTGYLRGAGLGDADAVMLGDYGHPHHVAYFFTGEERGDDQQMLELLKPYRPHRFRALMLLISSSGGAPPRRGPKRTPLRQRMR